MGLLFSALWPSLYLFQSDREGNEILSVYIAPFLEYPVETHSKSIYLQLVAQGLDQCIRTEKMRKEA